MRLLKNLHNWHGNIELKCVSAPAVDPKFLSSNDVLAHSRIVEEYASIRELIASVNTSAFERTKSTSPDFTLL